MNLYNRKFPPGIGIDLDGVLFDQLGSIIRESEKQFGIRIARSGVTEYDLSACYPVSPEQTAAFFRSPEFALGDPLENAAAATRTLSDDLVIHIVTARAPNLWRETYEWLRKEKIRYTHLRFIASREKPDYARIYRLKYFVEDHLETARALASAVETVFLIDYPYNRGETPPNVIRVTGWSEIIVEISRRAPTKIEPAFDEFFRRQTVQRA